MFYYVAMLPDIIREFILYNGSVFKFLDNKLIVYSAKHTVLLAGIFKKIFVVFPVPIHLTIYNITDN